MVTEPKEPDQLRQGKAFHKQIQKEWITDAEGEVEVERAVVRKNKHKGRVDVYITSDDMVAVVEIKYSDWDRMTMSNLKLNARTQVRQIWSYIESQLEGFGKDEPKDVCPGVIFPKRPKDPIRLKLIEEIFEEEGVQVIWQDESIDDRKARSRQSQVEFESQMKW